MFATDANGVKVWEASYLPFGGVHVSTGDAINLRFPGQWFHASSGLHQNWMRDYDPTTGRYMQADPLGLVDGASVYGYALQNPGRYTDPTGEFIPQAVVACLVNPWCRTAVGAAAGFLYGYLVDEDHCYEWDEALYYTILGGGAYYGAGKGLAPVFSRSGPFRRGGWLSTGQNWRLGWNRDGGRLTFRGFVKGLGKTDFFDGGPL